MDQSVISHFEAKFGALDNDELGDVVSRRSDLSDEAVEALDRVLASKGLKDLDLLPAPQPSALLTAGEGSQDVETQTRQSRKLWRGWLVKACNALVALTLAAPVQFFVKTAAAGALFTALLVMVALGFGYQIGRAITKEICANADMSVHAKKKKLWMMFGTLIPVYFLVYIISGKVFSSG